MTRDEEADEIVRRLKGTKLTQEQFQDRVMELIAKKMAEDLDKEIFEKYSTVYGRKNTV
jgi:hypothetical protein